MAAGFSSLAPGRLLAKMLDTVFSVEFINATPIRAIGVWHTEKCPACNVPRSDCIGVTSETLLFARKFLQATLRRECAFGLQLAPQTASPGNAF
jgi:hypothetical protein